MRALWDLGWSERVSRREGMILLVRESFTSFARDFGEVKEEKKKKGQETHHR